MQASDKRYLRFWSWLFEGGDGPGENPGYKNMVDQWLIVHGIVGVVLTWVVPLRLSEAAAVVLLPLAGVLVGLSFAWGGNAFALLQTSEVGELTERHPSGIRGYIFTFQLAIMLLLATLVLWGLAGLRVFDLLDRPNTLVLFVFAKILVYTASSSAIRECWHVVNGAQVLLLIRNYVQTAQERK